MTSTWHEIITTWIWSCSVYFPPCISKKSRKKKKCICISLPMSPSLALTYRCEDDEGPVGPGLPPPDVLPPVEAGVPAVGLEQVHDLLVGIEMGRVGPPRSIKANKNWSQVRHDVPNLAYGCQGKMLLGHVSLLIIYCWIVIQTVSIMLSLDTFVLCIPA